MSDYIIRSTHGKTVKVYHTDESCAGVHRAKEPQRVSKDYIERRDLRLCKRCAGEIENPDSYRRSLRSMVEAGDL